ncbi:MAG: hypothetical protein PUB18_03180 [bacterium]|nr:hypothetical protein [bacterium]
MEKVNCLFGSCKDKMSLMTKIKINLADEDWEWAYTFCTSILEANNQELLKYTKTIYLAFLVQYHELFQQVLDEDTTECKEDSLECFQTIFSLYQQMNSCVRRHFIVVSTSLDNFELLNTFYTWIAYFLNQNDDFLVRGLVDKLDRLFLSVLDNRYVQQFRILYYQQLPSFVSGICNLEIRKISALQLKQSYNQHKQYQKELFTMHARDGKIKVKIGNRYD